MRYRACFLLLSVIIYPVFFSARLPAEAPARADKATESNLAALEKGGESSLFEDIMFRATFDGAVDANLFKGEPKAKTEGRIVFEQGVFGKAIAVGERYATLIYKVGTSSRAPNMSFRSGSISFWFKPVDWEPSEQRPHVFYRFSIGPAAARSRASSPTLTAIWFSRREPTWTRKGASAPLFRV